MMADTHKRKEALRSLAILGGITMVLALILSNGKAMHEMDSAVMAVEDAIIIQGAVQKLYGLEEGEAPKATSLSESLPKGFDGAVGDILTNLRVAGVTLPEELEKPEVPTLSYAIKLSGHVITGYAKTTLVNISEAKLNRMSRASELTASQF